MGKKRSPQRTYVVNKTTGRLDCGTAGITECSRACFVKAKVSSFHTPDLQAATDQINAIFEGLQNDPKREKDTDLDILITPAGLLLAWAYHDIVTGYDDDERIVQALGLEGP